MLNDHIIEFIYNNDELIDDETFQAAWNYAKRKYADKESPMEMLLYSYGLACARLGLEAGYRYGRNPQLLIVTEAQHGDI